MVVQWEALVALAAKNGLKKVEKWTKVCYV